jgi:ABC-type phosphate transport system substrate-binding protein
MTRTGLIALGLTLHLLISSVAQADVVAVVSAQSPVSSLSKNAIADIFLGRALRFPDGEQAVPIDQQEGSTARDEFYSTFAGKSAAQLKAHWSKIIFTGRGKPPAAVSSGIEARRLVATNPRAITYLDRSLLDSSVKELRVQ